MEKCENGKCYIACSGKNNTIYNKLLSESELAKEMRLCMAAVPNDSFDKVLNNRFFVFNYCPICGCKIDWELFKQRYKDKEIGNLFPLFMDELFDKDRGGRI